MAAQKKGARQECSASGWSDSGDDASSRGFFKRRVEFLGIDWLEQVVAIARSLLLSWSAPIP